MDSFKKIKEILSLSIQNSSGTGNNNGSGDDNEEDDTERIAVDSKEELDEIISGILKDLDISKKKEVCVNILKEQIESLELELKELVSQSRASEDHMDETRVKLNKNLAPEYDASFVQSIDIDVRGVVKTLQAVPTASSSGRPGNTTDSSRKMYQQKGEEVLSIPTEKIKKETNKLLLTRTPNIIPRVMPIVGSKVYSMKHSALHYWVPGVVTDTRKNIYNELEFKVEFENIKKGSSPEARKPSPRDRDLSKKFLSPKHLAYNLPCPCILPVGTRVIAKFCAESRTSSVPTLPGYYYAGIIAEPPKNMNNYRYLIFFDDGYAHYVGQFDVLLVCETSKDVWRDIHPDSQEFIKNYLLKYPERPMLRLERGSLVSLEWNGRWFTTRVLEVDGSLAKMQFEVDRRTEWVYRGSLRLYPMFNKRTRSLQHPSATGVPRRNTGNIAIEYPDDEVVSEIQKGEPLAKKSTSFIVPPAPKPQPLGNFATSNTQNLPNVRPPTVATMGLEEYEGKLVRVKLPKDCTRPKQYEAHECGSGCVIPVNQSLPELATVNALMLPLRFGWNREVATLPKRYIFYRAPCGLRLRDYEELQQFLSKSGFNLGIDYFCFDMHVEISLLFTPIKQMYIIKDLSYGKEIVQIQCINSIDHDYPDFVQYTTQRLPFKKVKLNLDEEFLACCDCTDDCLDKEKCACWQLTLQGTRLSENSGAFHVEPGYQNRRLHDHIVTGIYECNKNCKCKSTCSNRVVQHPMKWQLQVFKTSTKGWGVRPVYDIPAGSFICVYVGQVLNDQVANEDGKNYGDEYLAELDYIEVVESFKEGFEADVVEPESNRGNSKNDDPDYRGDSDEDYGGKKSSRKKQTGKQGESSDEEVVSKRRPQRFNPTIANSQAKKKRKPTRELFGNDDTCYIMDAKTVGNIGRYLNHSCEPNVFVQNVFVDTHDLRFPWVCFFAYKHIRAGTELTWDYNYDVGSVPGKVLYCYCAAPECRGRLL